jgi:hypothetical protein
MNSLTMTVCSDIGMNSEGGEYMGAVGKVVAAKAVKGRRDDKKEAKKK